MSTVLVIVHVLVCLVLIAVVLLQRGKGAEIGAVFGGGGSSTVFGSRGAGNFLTKLTTASAVLFMVTSLSLSYIWTTAAEDRLFEDGADLEQAAPVVPATDNLFEEVEVVEPLAPEAPDSAQAPLEEGSLPPLTAPLEGEPAP